MPFLPKHLILPVNFLLVFGFSCEGIGTVMNSEATWKGFSGDIFIMNHKVSSAIVIDT